MRERVIYKNQISAKAFKRLERLEDSDRVLAEIASAMRSLQSKEKSQENGVTHESVEVKGFGKIWTSPPPQKKQSFSKRLLSVFSFHLK